MTDEEKAEEYVNKNPKAKILYSFEEDRIRQVKKAVLYGLTEGRKESAKDIEVLSKENKIKEEIIIGEQKEIEELKAHCKAVDDVNGKMKNCLNCKHGYANGIGCMMKARNKNCIEKDKWELAE